MTNPTLRIISLAVCLIAALPTLAQKLDADPAAMSARSHNELLKVVALDPSNRGALAALSIQSMPLALNATDPTERAKLIAEAVSWNQRWLQSGKPEATAYFNLGLLDHLQAAAKPDALIIDDGIKNLTAALELKPDFTTAMTYLAKLYTLRSPLETGSMASLHDLKLADDWTAKTADIQARQMPKTETVRLLTQVKPVYPPLARSARISGAVKFKVIIGTDGHIQSMELISGHPLLVDAARDALQQWVYEPKQINGKPARIMTEVSVNFQLKEQ